jgi:hypothetical protein
MYMHRIIIVGLLTTACFAQDAKEPPHSTEPAITRPSEQDRARIEVKAPSLNVSDQEATKVAIEFIDWAGASSVGQREQVRELLTLARSNKAVASAFCEEANRTGESDPSRALLALSVLGEMRSTVGAECFQKLLHRPLPEKGTVADGEIVEQTRLAMLQAKAVDGLAYLQTSANDEEVLWAVGKHASRIVRAEAIEAYLWNHKDSAAARATLLKYVQPKERIFLDRVRKEPADNAEGFNQRLAAFLKAHPETAAPAPKPIDHKGDEPQLPAGNEPPVR